MTPPRTPGTPALRKQLVSAAALSAALLSAHVIVSWLSQDGDIAPPARLAAFTAAAIAGASPTRTAFLSWKLAKGLYVAPVLFAHTPWLSADAATTAQILVFALVGVYMLADALEGWLERPLEMWMRPIAFAARLPALWPGDLWLNLAGAAVAFLLFLWSSKTVTRTVG